MKIDVFFTPAGLDEQAIRDKSVVFIDVLRTSSSIIAALENGAKEVIPVNEVEKALQMASNLAKGQARLCGERNGQIIEGFDLGNSPEEYTKEKVSGKSIVLSTSNGVITLNKAKEAKIRELVVASFSNISIVKEFILKPENIENDLAIVCAGKSNRFSMEDVICAGLLIEKIVLDKKSEFSYVLSDTAKAARMLFEQYRGNEKNALMESEHGKFLTSIGFENDVENCSKIDLYQILPRLENGVIKQYKVETKKFKRVN